MESLYSELAHESMMQAAVMSCIKPFKNTRSALHVAPRYAVQIITCTKLQESALIIGSKECSVSTLLIISMTQ